MKEVCCSRVFLNWEELQSIGLVEKPISSQSMVHIPESKAAQISP